MVEYALVTSLQKEEILKSFLASVCWFTFLFET